MAGRTPEEIRASIEHNRKELGSSLEKLRAEAIQIADWRAQLRAHQRQAVIGAALAGFVLGGGFAALGALTGGGRRRR